MVKSTITYLIPGCRFLTDIQENGVPFDIAKTNSSRSHLCRLRLTKLVAELYKTSCYQLNFEKINGKSFNPNSTVQLRSLLFDFLGLNPTGKKTGTGANSNRRGSSWGVGNAIGSPSPHPRNTSESPRLKILIWTKSYHSWIEIVDYAQVLTFIAQLVGGSALLGSLICNSYPRDNPIVKGCIKAATRTQDCCNGFNNSRSVCSSSTSERRGSKRCI